DRGDAIAFRREIDNVGSGTASQVEQVTAGGNRAFERVTGSVTHRAEQWVGGIRAIVGCRAAVEGVLRLAQRYDSHGARLHPVFNEHTHRRQVASHSTSSAVRDSRRLFVTIEARGVSRRLPMAL